MRPIQVKQLDYDLTPTAGLALVGHHLKLLAPVLAEVDAALPVRSGVASSDIVRSYLGLLVQGKSDFDAIENLRGDKFFKQALGIGLLPSSPTLRQRMDAHAGELAGHVPAMIERLLARCADGYCPLAAYLGSHGLCLELSLRPGVQHSAKHTDDDLCGIVPLAQRLSAAGPKAALLARLDSGFDAAALMACIESMNRPGVPQADWIIKWNPRGTDAAQLAAQRDAAGTLWEHPRKGKRVATWEQAVQVSGVPRAVRRVLRLVERTIGSGGQHLILPEYELDGWTTTLPQRLDAGQIIALYAEHGTHEQFHAEFKTDMDLTRLPSGKFDTNALVCRLAALAMNILRLMGQRGLLGPDAPVRHAAKRRRIKTVMQELIYRAGRLIEHGRQLVLGLGANDRAATVFMRLHAQFAATQ